MDTDALIALTQDITHAVDSLYELLLDIASRFGAKHPIVLVPCIHEKNQYIAYGRNKSSALATRIEGQWYFSSQDFDTSKDLSWLLVEYPSASSDDREQLYIILLYFSTISLTSQNQISKISRLAITTHQINKSELIRKATIEAKLASNDIGTFFYKLIHDQIPRIFPSVEYVSIFSIDKYTGLLTLRGQTPRRTDGRHMSDITIEIPSKSRLSKSYKERCIISEYSANGSLHTGKTRELERMRIYSRMYYPIKLSFISDTTSSLRIGDPTLGVIRVSNIGEFSWSAPRPFHIVDETTLSILAENIYSILEVFTTKQVDGFDRDLAFHAAKTPATGALKNLRLAAQLLFDTSEVDFLPEHDTSVRKQFEITQVGRFSIQDLILAFNNAYALMLNLSSQIDRSNLTDEFHTPYDSVIDKLFSDVLIKSIKLIPYFNASQSELPNSEATSRLIINRIFDLELPPPVMGNGPLLMSVFNNIFENSVKYARRGEPVKIDISWMDDNDFIVISIRDYGIGVPASEVERIFTRGIRTKAAKEHSVRGSGLGLAFCRKVVRSFKGDITAISHETGISVEVRLRKARIL